MRIVYLILAIVGAAVPMYYFILWFEEFGYSITAMNDAWFVSNATRGLAYDLTIAWVAFAVWVIYESVLRKAWLNLLALPASFVGLSCGLPLYLYLRSRPSQNGSL